MSFYYVKKGENKMKITQEKLNEIITSHDKWLRNEDGGEKANLGDENLGGADLRGADLRGANLRGANLCNADLCDADLGGVNLDDINLDGTNLSVAKLDQTYYQITRIGSRNGTTTYCVEDNNVVCGCWNKHKGGKLAEFKKRIESVYGENGKTPNKKYYTQYMAAVEFFTKMAKLAKE